MPESIAYDRDTHYPHQLGEGLTELLSMLQRAPAQSRITRTPTYFYNGTDEAGMSFDNPKRRILVNPSGDSDVGNTINHESIHQVLAPFLKQMVQQNPSPAHIPSIMRTLGEVNSGLYGDRPSPATAYTEGAAYVGSGEGSRVGLDPSQGSEFLRQIMSAIGDPRARQQLQRLTVR